MTHPTDDELEAMAARLEASAYVRSPAHEIEAAAMLRACKGITAALEGRAKKADAERAALRGALREAQEFLSIFNEDEASRRVPPIQASMCVHIERKLRAALNQETDA